MFNQMLVLIAAHNYDADDTDDIYRHLTNTARAVEDMEFEESKFVKLIDDLPEISNGQVKDKVQVDKIKADICAITSELFCAFEAEYTVFAPMDSCFEIFGLDFMLSENGEVHLLEVNPGPDFKQTGSRLKVVIERLFEDTFRIVVDKDEGENFTCCYDKVASTSGLGGMAFS